MKGGTCAPALSRPLRTNTKRRELSPPPLTTRLLPKPRDPAGGSPSTSRLPRMGSPLEPKAGARGHHRRSPCVDGGDDLLGIDPLQVDRGRAEVGVAELALDDVERNALASELE